MALHQKTDRESPFPGPPRSLLTPPNSRALSLHAPAEGRQLQPDECAAIYVGRAYELDTLDEKHPSRDSVSRQGLLQMGADHSLHHSQRLHWLLGK